MNKALHKSPYLIVIVIIIINLLCLSSESSNTYFTLVLCITEYKIVICIALII